MLFYNIIFEYNVICIIIYMFFFKAKIVSFTPLWYQILLFCTLFYLMHHTFYTKMSPMNVISRVKMMRWSRSTCILKCIEKNKIKYNILLTYYGHPPRTLLSSLQERICVHMVDYPYGWLYRTISKESLRYPGENE